VGRRLVTKSKSVTVTANGPDVDDDVHSLGCVDEGGDRDVAERDGEDVTVDDIDMGEDGVEYDDGENGINDEGLDGDEDIESEDYDVDEEGDDVEGGEDGEDIHV
jgi:hypothetical protein